MTDAIIVGIALLVVSAFALPLSKTLVRGWVRVYTAPVHPVLRDRRREEMHSELWEQEASDREAGYRPVEIALHMLVRWVRGAPADVAWSAPQAIPLEDLMSLQLICMLLYLAVNYEWVAGPVPAIGPLSAQGVDVVLRVSMVLSALLQTKHYRHFRRLRFSIPPVGDGDDALIERYRAYERLLVQEARDRRARRADNAGRSRLAWLRRRNRR